MNTYRRIGSNYRGLGDPAVTTPAAPTPAAPTNWVLWGSVAALVAVGGYLYYKRR